LGDERIRPLGDAGQHAIGNAIVVLFSCSAFVGSAATMRPACCPTGLILSSIVGIVLFTAGRGGEVVFRMVLLFCAEPRAQSQPGKELISCLSPRVV